MAKKHKHEEHENHERWLVSYADFMTLLFAFFTSMYAISNLDLQKAGRLVMSTRAAFNSPVMTGGRGAMAGGSGGASSQEEQVLVAPAFTEGAPEETEGDPGAAPKAALDEIQRQIQTALAEEGLEGQVTFRRIGLELSITLSETLFFESGSAEIRPEALPTLGAIAHVLGTTHRNIRIEGHTDSQPISSSRYPSNWELSTARATSILRYLVEKEEFDPERLGAAGYGPYRPANPNLTAEDRAKNRRVEIVIVGDPAVGGPQAASDAAVDAALPPLPGDDALPPAPGAAE